MFGSIGMDHVIIESSYKGQFCEGIIGKRPFYGRFHIILFKKYMNKKFGSHNTTVLYQKLCYEEVCYKETSHCILTIGLQILFALLILFQFQEVV